MLKLSKFSATQLQRIVAETGIAAAELADNAASGKGYVGKVTREMIHAKLAPMRHSTGAAGVSLEVQTQEARTAGKQRRIMNSR